MRDFFLHLGPAHQLHERADHEDEGYQNRDRPTDPHDRSAATLYLLEK